MNLPTDLTGKVALVTGSSRGIGAGIARALSARGARTIVNYVADPQGRNLADAEAVASEIDSTVIQCDVGDDNQVAAMMQRVRQDCGGLDILVNNAGVIRDRTLAKMSHEEWDAVIRVNLTGTFNCMHHAVPLLRAEGRVVNLSSVTGVVGLFGQANYAASKAGIIALTRTAARELARQRITVNAIAPGFIDTDMTRDTLSDQVKGKFMEQVPIGRIGTVADIVNAVMFLCSPESGYITGQVLHVNGGFFMG
jgi:3-oxoacyl-[acyl-carrier protein] reductase